MFQQCQMKITIETNLQITNFFDVTINLKNGKYYSFRKENNDPLDMNHLSNNTK